MFINIFICALCAYDLLPANITTVDFMYFSLGYTVNEVYDTMRYVMMRYDAVRYVTLYYARLG